MSTCVKWLKGYLENAGHEVLVEVVREDAKKTGFTRSQLKSARKELGVVTLNDFERKGDDTCLWWWKLP